MPHVGTGAAYPTHTALGQIMDEQGRKAKDVAYLSNIHPRILTEYLAGRKGYSAKHLAALSRLLEVDPEEILADDPVRNSDETTEAVGRM